MARSRTLRVTPNVLMCLQEIKNAIKALPEGDLKKRAKASLRYLEHACKGERQPLRGFACPGGTLIIKM